jgi:hypothetical protein
MKTPDRLSDAIGVMSVGWQQQDAAKQKELA